MTSKGKSKSRPTSRAESESPPPRRDSPPHLQPTESSSLISSSGLQVPPQPLRPAATTPSVPISFTGDDLRDILADNRDAMAQMLQSFVTINAATSNRRNSHSAPALARPLKLNLKNPEEFDGKSKNVVNFLSEVNAHILADPVSFELDQTKIMFFLSFCSKDSARTWKNKILTDIENDRCNIDTYAQFLTEFKRVFHNPHAEEQAQRDLMSMRQGSSTAVDFLIAFEEVKERSGFCDKSAIFHLKRALNVRLLGEITRTCPGLVSFNDWKDAAVECDHRLQEINATVAHQRAESAPSNAGSRLRWFFPTPRPAAPPAPPAVATSSSTPSATPAPRASLPPNISAPPDKFLRRRPSPGCFNCGATTHLARDCNLPFNAEFRKASRGALEKARAVLEEFESLPAEDREEIFKIGCDDGDDSSVVEEDFVDATE